MTGVLGDVSLLDRLHGVPIEPRAAGDYLVEAGTVSGKLFVLVDGQVTAARDGVTLGAISEPGAVIGEIEAHGPCRVLDQRGTLAVDRAMES